MMLKKQTYLLLLIASLILVLGSCRKENPNGSGQLQIMGAKAGILPLKPGEENTGIPVDSHFSVEFTTALDAGSAAGEIYLENPAGDHIAAGVDLTEGNTLALIAPENILEFLTVYELVIGSGLKGSAGEHFPGYRYTFTTEPGVLKLRSISLNGTALSFNETPMNVPIMAVEFEVSFSEPVQEHGFENFFSLTGGASFEVEAAADRQIVWIRSLNSLSSLKKYSILISSNLTAESGNQFPGYSMNFFTALDSTYKFPEITDEELLDRVQEYTLRYFYDFAHPASGLARERNTSGDIVTTGGSGFGFMAMVVGMERGWISRNDGLSRMNRILDFLETCDRFHGAYPHWLNGATGKTHPFSNLDDGGDLVETSFLMQGLLTFREYLDSLVPEEQDIRQRIYAIWADVEWEWYTREKNVLYWHWSANHDFAMNMQITGYNETLITYVLAAASPTHPIDPPVYHQGYTRNGAIQNGRSYFGITLPLGYDYGGPLFFAHYSFLGLDPRNLEDDYANYWEQNVAHATINYLYCSANPQGYLGYSEDCWGLTASDNQDGYNAHSPTNDRGVIAPTAAVASLPYTPEESMNAIRHFYYLLGDKLWGPYGFYDAFNLSLGWWADSYLAIDQGPIVVMIENYRTGLLWDLFMNNPEIQNGLNELGFTY